MELCIAGVYSTKKNVLAVVIRELRYCIQVMLVDAIRLHSHI